MTIAVSHEVPEGDFVNLIRAHFAGNRSLIGAHLEQVAEMMAAWFEFAPALVLVDWGVLCGRGVGVGTGFGDGAFEREAVHTLRQQSGH